MVAEVFIELVTAVLVLSLVGNCTNQGEQKPVATTATGTTAFARGGGGGHGGGGHGGGHSGGFGGGGHGFGHAMGHGGFGGHRVAINRGSIGHGRLDGRRFGRGFYAYGGNYCDPYYYPYGCYGY